MSLSQAERTAALEVEVREMKTELQSVNAKLDELIGIKNKGVGAFWLASSLIGTGIVGGVFAFLDWVKGGVGG